jgi:hypothetical protein
MNFIKTALVELVQKQIRLEELISQDQYSTFNRLPIQLIYSSKVEDDNRSGFFLNNCSSKMGGSIGYASFKRMYFDAAFATMLQVSSKHGSKIHEYFLKHLVSKSDNFLLTYLSNDITLNFLTINDCFFEFDNIQPDDNETTSSDHPFYCPDVDIYNSDLHFNNILSAVNCTKFFSFIRELIQPNNSIFKELVDYIESIGNNDIDIAKIPHVDLAMNIQTILNIVNDYISTYETMLTLEVHT